MNNFKEKLMGNKTASIVIAAIIIILIVLGVLVGTGTVDFSGENSASVSDSLNNSEGDENFIASESSENASGAYSDINAVARNFATVSFPVFADPDLFDYKGGQNSCGDEIAWVTAEVAPTPAILNATLDTMFNYDRDLGFTPGNTVAMQADLEFDRAVITNRVAEVYLEGEFDIEDDCDISRILTQIESATLQFGTVSAVQIFLNDELVR
jgi:hypothetical protein